MSSGTFTSIAIAAFLFLSKCFLPLTGICVVVRHSNVLKSKLLLKIFTRHEKLLLARKGGNTLSSRRRNAISCKTAMRWRNRIQIEMWFIVVCILINNEYASLLFVQTFFLIVSACWASLPVFERKDWREQVANLQCFQLSTNLDKDLFHYLWYVVKKNCCGLTRLRLVSRQHFDHCDDVYSSIRLQTTLNHIQNLRSYNINSR